MVCEQFRAGDSTAHADHRGVGAMASEAEYYSRRSREEREAAMRAPHPQAREIHRELAEAYELRVRELTAQVRRSEMHLVSAA